MMKVKVINLFADISRSAQNRKWGFASWRVVGDPEGKISELVLFDYLVNQK